jgi:hypothetical protein
MGLGKVSSGFEMPSPVDRRFMARDDASKHPRSGRGKFIVVCGGEGTAAMDRRARKREELLAQQKSVDAKHWGLVAVGHKI